MIVERSMRPTGCPTPIWWPTSRAATASSSTRAGPRAAARGDRAARPERRAPAAHPSPPRSRRGEPHLQGALGVEILAHPLEAEHLMDVDRTIEPGEMLEVGGLAIEPLHTPGHTAGCSPRGQRRRRLHRRHAVQGLGRRRAAPGSTGFEDLKHSIMDVLMKLPPARPSIPATPTRPRSATSGRTTRSSASGAASTRRPTEPLQRLGGEGDAGAVGARLRRRPQGLGALGRAGRTTSSQAARWCELGH